MENNNEIWKKLRLVIVHSVNLAAAFKKVIALQLVRIETGLALKLRSMELIRFQGNDAIPSCELYRQYFGDCLGL